MKGFHKLLLVAFLIIQGCGGGSSSGGGSSNNDCDNCEQEEPTTFLSGRVVDGPLSEAQVFIDLNGDNLKSDNEPEVKTDETGFFTIPESEERGTKIVAIGGRDSQTGIELTKLKLVAEIPSDITQSISVTPLTTLLFGKSIAEKQELLEKLGLKGDVQAVQYQDNWALSETNQTAAIAIQQVNQQIGLLMLSSSSMSNGLSASGEQDTGSAVIQAISELAITSEFIDLTEIESVRQIFSRATTIIAPSDPMTQASIDAIAQPIVSYSRILASSDINPTSETAIEMSKVSQSKLQTNITSLVAGDTSVEDFQEQTRFDNLFTDIELPPGQVSIDTDGDNIPDIVDTDDDNDGDIDSIDPAPLNIKPKIELTLDITSEKVTINWQATDPEDNAVIKFYYNTNNDGFEGKNISQDEFYEDSDTSSYEWQTLWDASQLQSGNYYVYASINDGKNQPYLAYAKEKITISRASSINGTPEKSVLQGQSYSFKPTVDTDEALSFTAANLPKWMQINSSTGEIKGTPANDHVGNHSDIQITVTDAIGNNASLDAFDINVINVNDKPIASPMSVDAVENISKQITLIGTDVDNNQLSYVIVNQPMFGFIQLESNQAKYKSTSDTATKDGFTYRVNDGELDSELAYVNINITPVNDAPSVESLNVAATEQVKQQITLIGTDTDSENLEFHIVSLTQNGVLNIEDKKIESSDLPQVVSGPLTYTSTSNSASQDQFTFKANDGFLDSSVAIVNINILPVSDKPQIISLSNGRTELQTYEEKPLVLKITDFVINDPDSNQDQLTLSVIPPAQNSNYTLSGTTITPNKDYKGSIIVAVRVNDGTHYSNDFSFKIKVQNTNDAPTITGTPAINVEQDSAYGFTPTASDIDVGDTLTFNIDNKPSWAAFNQQTGALTGTPGNEHVGTYTNIIISVSDNNGDTASLPAFNIVVTNKNDAPTITGTPETTVNKGSTYAFTPAASDIDVGDTLTFNIVNKPSWAAFNQQTGALTGTPSNEHVGTTTNIIISVSDNNGATTSLPTFNIKVKEKNHAPTITGTPATNVEQDDSYSFTPTANDVDNDNLTFSIFKKPDWADFNPLTGALTGIPDNDDIGTTTDIIIGVSDNDGRSASLPPFNLEVINVNDAPTITGTPETTVTQGRPYAFAPTASDIDKDDLTFSIQNKPNWASFSVYTGLILGTPGNEHVGTTDNIIISVSDNNGGTASLPAFNIVVTNKNDAPTITGTPATSVEQDSTYSFTPTASDIDVGDTLTFNIDNKPSWATFNQQTGALTGTPGNEHVGTTTNIIISVSDNNGGTASLPTFNLVVTNKNDAPTITGTPETSVNQGSAYGFTPTASDIDVGDTLTFNIVNKPSWAAFNQQTGALTGTPGNEHVGTTTNIIISVSDNNGDTASLSTFNIEVKDTNDAPTVDSKTIITLPNIPVPVVLSASDPENDNLTYKITSVPLSGTLKDGDAEILNSALPHTVKNIGSLKYIPTGSVAETNSTFKFIASDNEHTSDEGTITFEKIAQPMQIHINPLDSSGYGYGIFWKWYAGNAYNIEDFKVTTFCHRDGTDPHAVNEYDFLYKQRGEKYKDTTTIVQRLTTNGIPTYYFRWMPSNLARGKCNFVTKTTYKPSTQAPFENQTSYPHDIGNYAPTITVTSPGNHSDPNNPKTKAPSESYTVKWKATDSDYRDEPSADAKISLYYSKTHSIDCSSGSLIEKNISVTQSSIAWAIPSSLASDEYFICATINDGVNPKVSSYGSEKVTVNKRPTIGITGPSVESGENYVLINEPITISWNATDDETPNPTIKLWYDTDDDRTNNGDSTRLIYTSTNKTGSVNFDPKSNKFEGFNPTQIYYLYATVNDGIHTDVVSGYIPILVNYPPTIEIKIPSNGDIVGENPTVLYDHSDDGQNPQRTFYFKKADSGDNSNLGTEMTFITGNKWDTSSVESGTYVITGVIRDGINSAVQDQITVTLNKAPTFTITSPLEDTFADLIDIKWQITDTDSNDPKVSLYFKEAHSDEYSLIAEDIDKSRTSYLWHIADIVKRKKLGKVLHLRAKIEDGVNTDFVDSNYKLGPQFKLNDTGQTCSDNPNPKRDCNQGRDADATVSKVGNGVASFDFTRLNQNGTEQTGNNYSSNPWHCVKDNVTGLVWEVKPAYNPNLSQWEKFSWVGFQGSGNDDRYPTDCAWCGLIKQFKEANIGSGQCGYKNWRVASPEELTSILIDNTSLKNASSEYGFSMDPNYFPPNNYQDGYWTSFVKTRDTNDTDLSESAWSLKLNSENGFVAETLKISNGVDRELPVILVAGMEQPFELTNVVLTDGSKLSPNRPETTPNSRYNFNEDGTVTDKWTGLMWQRCPLGMSWNQQNQSCNGMGQGYSWQEALSLAEGNSHGGYNDWRLPNIKEMRTILEYGNIGQINTDVFFMAPYAYACSLFYWTSSYKNSSNAWTLMFVQGSSVAKSKSDKCSVRLVRQGEFRKSNAVDIFTTEKVSQSDPDLLRYKINWITPSKIPNSGDIAKISLYYSTDGVKFTNGTKITDNAKHSNIEWNISDSIPNGTYYLWAEITTVSGQTIRVYDDDVITVAREFRLVFLDTLSNTNGDYYQLYTLTSFLAEVEIGGQDAQDIANVDFQLKDNSGEIVKPNITYKNGTGSTTSSKRYKLELDTVGLKPQQTYKLYVNIDIQGKPSITKYINIKVANSGRMSGTAQKQVNDGKTTIKFNESLGNESVLYIYDNWCPNTFFDIFPPSGETNNGCGNRKTVQLNNSSGSVTLDEDIKNKALVMKTGNYIHQVGAPITNDHQSENSLLVFKGKLWLFSNERIWNSDNGLTWTQVTDQPAFAPRVAYKALVFKDQLWVVGGSRKNSDSWGHTYLNDVWKSSDGINWTKVRNHGADNGFLSSKSDLELVVFNDGNGEKLWLIGGYAGGASYYHKIWASGDGINWTEKTLPTTDDLFHVGSAQAVVFNNALWLFGVDDSNSYKRSVYRYDGTSWTYKSQIPAENNEFGSGGHDAIVFNGSIWVAGSQRCSVLGPETASDCQYLFRSNDGVNWEPVTNSSAKEVMLQRQFSALAVFDEKLWISGGSHSNHWSELAFSSNGTTWTKTGDVLATPGPRTDHQLVKFDNKMWLIGGSGRDAIINRPKADLKNDTWYSSNGTTWQMVDNVPFSARRGHQVTSFNGALWLIGGYDGEYKNDVWKFNNSLGWTQVAVTYPTDRNYELPAITNHQVVTYKNELWLIGGRRMDNSSISLNREIWRSSNGTYWYNWTPLNGSGGNNIAREGHQVVVFKNKILLIGGYNSNGEYTNDIWQFDGSWSRLMYQAAFPVRAGHHVTVINNGTRLLLSGGYDASGEKDDLWYSDDGINWVEYTANEEKIPLSIKGHQTLDFTDSTGNKLWMIGGSNKPEGKRFHEAQGDVWTFDYSTKRWTKNESLTAPYISDP